MKELIHTLTNNDLACLEHLRNVGHLINEMTLVQECANVRPEPSQLLQLNSVVYLMTVQLDGLVERCHQRWLTGEGNV